MSPIDRSRQYSPHIAVFTPHLGSGGAERMSVFVTQALAAAGMRVDLIVNRMDGVLLDHPVVRAHGVDLAAGERLNRGLNGGLDGGLNRGLNRGLDRDLDEKKTGEWAVAPLLRYYRRERPDLVLAMGRTAKFVTGIASQFEPALPFVISVRGVLDRPRLTRFWPRALFGHAPERWLYRRAVAAQATLRVMSDQVERAFGLPPDRIATIPNPVLLDRPETPLPPGHAAWFDRPVVVSAGRLEPQKDQAELLRAFAAANLGDTARLLILGVGPLEGRLRRQAQALGIADAVILGGYVPDVRPYFERSAGFVLSSAHESFGLVLLEALACRLAIASYDCPTGPAELLDHGRMGRLIAPGDTSAMAQAMRDLVAGSLSPPEPAALARHLARFAPDAIARQWAGFVRDTLARQAKTGADTGAGAGAGTGAGTGAGAGAAAGTGAGTEAGRDCGGAV